MPKWTWHAFEDLTPTLLYDILQLRELVFTIGQNCNEPDMDDMDKTALHFTGHDNGRLIACLRAYESGNKIKIGRIVVHPDYQGKGLGREMMQIAIPYLQNNHPLKPLEMSAQYHLEKFYQSLGFETVSDVYIEAGIQHVRMTHTTH